MKIITEFWRKPIPVRDYDWEATREGYDEGDLVGHGSTELEAITDLINQEKESE